MGERIFLAGKLTDLSQPEQLGRLNDLLVQILAVINQFDPNSFALAWIEGAVVGQVIASAGTANAPEWSASPTLTGLKLSGLSASQLVVTDASKQLASSALQGVTNGDTHDHSGGDGAQIDHGGTAGLDHDDHTQYHTDARGDARYPIKAGTAVNLPCTDLATVIALCNQIRVVLIANGICS